MPIRTILKRSFHGLALLLIAVVAYFQAKGTGQLIGMALMKPADRHSTLPDDAAQLPGPSVAAKSGQAIRDRNPFDSMPGPLCQPMMLQRAAPTPTPPVAPATSTVPAPETPRRQASILSQVRVVPEQRDGQFVGLRLFGIRQGSILSALGLRNGDRLESINGFELGSPEKALQAYARLRTASHLHVLLTRVGKPLQIDLHIS